MFASDTLSFSIDVLETARELGERICFESFLFESILQEDGPYILFQGEPCRLTRKGDGEMLCSSQITAA
jgi:hypothetical protein